MALLLHPAPREKMNLTRQVQLFAEKGEHRRSILQPNPAGPKTVG
ncbi:hypothetical protein BJY21_000302 [Kineosphaera limosa]|nr:hypothetical protein [Kineosphaera limosa]NYD99117.1 hypothetical protein [Kineosphaera limosa]